MSDREENTEEQAGSQPGSVHREEQQDTVAEEAGGVVEENQPSTDEQAPVEEQTQVELKAHTQIFMYNYQCVNSTCPSEDLENPTIIYS